MKVYKALADAKVQFHRTELKKTGYNSYSGYKYFELRDFIKPILEILAQNNLVSFVSFADFASLTLIHCEDNSEIVINSPLSSANLKACHPVQNLGAVQTYLRRYLYIALFDIIENDALDAGSGHEDKKIKTSEDKKIKTSEDKKIKTSEDRKIKTSEDRKIKTSEDRKIKTRTCSKCNTKINEAQARLSLDKKNTLLCSACINAKTPEETIKEILSSVNLDKYFMAFLNWAKNTEALKETIYQYGVKTGKWEALIIRFLRLEISKIDAEFIKSFAKESTLKDYADGLNILN